MRLLRPARLEELANEMRNKHNVLFLESGLGYGGSSIFLHYFLKNLDSELFRPSVAFYYQTDGPDISKIQALGTEFTDLGIKPYQRIDLRSKNLSTHVMSPLERLRNYSISLTELITIEIPLIFRLTEIMRKNKTELVVFNNDLQYHVAGAIASRISNLPCVCRKAGIGGGRRIKRNLSRFVDLFIASSIAASQDYLQDGLPREKLVMIHEGIDLRELNPSQNSLEVRKELGIGSDRVVVGSVARLSAGKGHLDLVEVAVSVVKANPKVIFLIAGDAPLSNGKILHMLKEKAFDLGLTGSVIFTGWRNDIPDLLSIMDIYVQNSIQPEGLGIAAIEASAMGKPMIVTDAGGLRETVVDKVSGYVVPVRHMDLLVSSINRLATSPALREKMGKEARKLVERDFNLENLVGRYEREFLKLLDRDKASRHS